MSDKLLWLAYFVSGGVAFALVYRLGWKVALSMLAATLVGVLLSLVVMLAFPKEDASYWFQIELVMNGSLSLIFAGVGAAIAYALRERHE